MVSLIEQFEAFAQSTLNIHLLQLKTVVLQKHSSQEILSATYNEHKAAFERELDQKIIGLAANEPPWVGKELDSQKSKITQQWKRIVEERLPTNSCTSFPHTIPNGFHFQKRELNEDEEY